LRIICLDLEGVLIPEIWISLADITGIEKLKLTTRDIEDYDKLMSFRLKILREKKLKINDILKAVDVLNPFEGAIEFINNLSNNNQVIILSDTFYEISYPLLKKLGNPTIFCHHLSVDNSGEILGYKLRQKNQKKSSVEALKSLNFEVFAAGDSFNDVDMLKSADFGVWFKPPENLVNKYPNFDRAYNYNDLFNFLTNQ
jgi:phosphoserine/homoserine phosphotransferase